MPHVRKWEAAIGVVVAVAVPLAVWWINGRLPAAAIVLGVTLGICVAYLRVALP